jgi:serine/threonine protein kinase
MPLLQIASIALQLLESLEALAAMDYAHGDLKDENIGLSEGRVQLLDFGLLQKCEQPILPNKLQTLRVRAPECLLGHEFATPLIDIWSLGCLLTELITNKSIFGDDEDDFEGQKNCFKKIVKLIGFPSNSFLEKCVIYQKKFKNRDLEKDPIEPEPEGSPYRNSENLLIRLEKWRRKTPNFEPELAKRLKHYSDCLKPLPSELQQSWIEFILKMVRYEERISAGEALSCCRKLERDTSLHFSRNPVS